MSLEEVGRGRVHHTKDKSDCKNYDISDGKQGNCVCSRLSKGALCKNQTNDKNNINVAVDISARWEARVCVVGSFW